MEITEMLTVDFTAYLAIAFILYAIRQATRLSNRYIPVVALALGVAYSAFEAGSFGPDILIGGIQYALYGVGSVAAIKYALEKTQSNDR